MLTVQPKSNSSGAISLTQKLTQGALLLATHVSRVRAGALPYTILEDIQEYDALCRLYLGRSLMETRVFEIGYGTRPYRLATLISLGIHAYGVDLDVPLLKFERQVFLNIYRHNGFERLAKSMFRFFIADSFQNRQMRNMLRLQGKTFTAPAERFLTGNAAQVIPTLDPVDLFISEDVFEHIPRADLETIVAQMAEKLPPDGLALIRPNVFTGITGGHRVEWFEGNLRKGWYPRWSEPWGHLRGDGREGDTYLNKLTRSDYRALFEPYFDILLERVKYPDLGRSYLTENVARELSHWPREELFSNQVLFVLKKK